MCIFCKIANHEIGSKVVYENEKVLAILDLSQVTVGHTLVMPKKHIRNILEADSETMNEVMEVTRKLAQQIVKNTGAAGCNILSNCNEAAGQSVDHMHVHIIPRYNENDGLVIQFNEGQKPDLGEVLTTISK